MSGARLHELVPGDYRDFFHYSPCPCCGGAVYRAALGQPLLSLTYSSLWCDGDIFSQSSITLCCNVLDQRAFWCFVWGWVSDNPDFLLWAFISSELSLQAGDARTTAWVAASAISHKQNHSESLWIALQERSLHISCSGGVFLFASDVTWWSVTFFLWTLHFTCITVMWQPSSSLWLISSVHCRY